MKSGKSPCLLQNALSLTGVAEVTCTRPRAAKADFKRWSVPPISIPVTNLIDCARYMMCPVYLLTHRHRHRHCQRLHLHMRASSEFHDLLAACTATWSLVTHSPNENREEKTISFVLEDPSSCCTMYTAVHSSQSLSHSS
jgi:hypothetical protein